MGLPSLQLVLAENQRAIARALSRAGAALLLDRSKLESDLRNALTQLFRDPSQLVRMSAAAAAVVDGLGAARVAQHFKSGLFA